MVHSYVKRLNEKMRAGVAEATTCESQVSDISLPIWVFTEIHLAGCLASCESGDLEKDIIRKVVNMKWADMGFGQSSSLFSGCILMVQ